MIRYRDNDWDDVRTKTNRERKTEPKRSKSWCDRCDRNIIVHGGKCEVCGFKDTITKHSR